jgi:hypothetical protein
MENPPDHEWRCNCHYKHIEKFAQIDKYTGKHDEEHIRIWQAIDKLVKNKLFYVLVALVISTLGFQWLNYEKLTSIDKSVTEQIAIIKTQIKNHIGSNYPHYKP